MILSRYERIIAKRYLLPGKGEGERFIFLVSMISLAAVAPTPYDVAIRETVGTTRPRPARARAPAGVMTYRAGSRVGATSSPPGSA